MAQNRSQVLIRPNVREGSITPVLSCPRLVRSPSESGRGADPSALRPRARRRHRAASFDHLVGAGEQRQSHSPAETPARERAQAIDRIGHLHTDIRCARSGPRHIALFEKATAECSEDGRFLGYAAEKTDHRHRRLLRARNDRPRDSHAAEKRDEFPPPHSITSSARASNDGGMRRPSALAVLRLTTSSNLVGCSTGRSAGLAPLKILSTTTAFGSREAASDAFARGARQLYEQ